MICLEIRSNYRKMLRLSWRCIVFTWRPLHGSRFSPRMYDHLRLSASEGKKTSSNFNVSERNSNEWCHLSNMNTHALFCLLLIHIVRAFAWYWSLMGRKGINICTLKWLKTVFSLTVILCFVFFCCFCSLNKSLPCFLCPLLKLARH